MTVKLYICLNQMTRRSPHKEQDSISVSPKMFFAWQELRDDDFDKYDTHIVFLALKDLRWS